MKKALLLFALFTFQNVAHADPARAAQVCAEAASKVLGDSRYELQSLRKPLLASPKYKIHLQSDSARDVRCVVFAQRIKDLSIDNQVSDFSS